MHLSKHHGLGNDFLVLLDPDGRTPVEPALARALCHRRTGIGADGLLWAGPAGDGFDVTMTLHNADGSRAEMSGNGIRCLAQAVARARGAGSGALTVLTDAGVRLVEVGAVDATTIAARVDMGAVNEVAVPELGFECKDVLGADVGNPHAVALFADRQSLDAAADAFAMTDRNVEFLVPGPGDDELTMRVVERGAGETQACGTGACAAAWAANRWGLVGSRVTVHMPGGDAVVELGDTVHLTGSAVLIAEIEVP